MSPFRITRIPKRSAVDASKSPSSNRQISAAGLKYLMLAKVPFAKSQSKGEATTTTPTVGVVVNAVGFDVAFAFRKGLRLIGKTGPVGVEHDSANESRGPPLGQATPGSVDTSSQLDLNDQVSLRIPKKQDKNIVSDR
jgi:hypothetical protein